MQTKVISWKYDLIQVKKTTKEKKRKKDTEEKIGSIENFQYTRRHPRFLKVYFMQICPNPIPGKLGKGGGEEKDIALQSYCKTKK